MQWRTGLVFAVADVERSVAFYKDVLGFQEWFQWGSTAGLRFGDVRIMVEQNDKASAEQQATRGGGVQLYIDLESANIDAYGYLVTFARTESGNAQQ